MDKQQATEHILKRLRAGYSQLDIADELSRLIKAPTSLTGKFVQQVAASHPEAVPTTPQIQEEDDRPDWLKAMTDQSPSDRSLESTDEDLPKDLGQNVDEGYPTDEGYPLEQVQEVNIPIESESDQYGDLPPGLQQIIEDGYPPDQGYPLEQEQVASTTIPENYLPATQEEQEIPVDESEEISSEEQRARQEAIKQDLTVFVLKQLGSHKRHSDVVAEICQRTGWDWNQAQRFVSRIQTEHHDELTKKQNRMLIPIGIAFIIGGVFLIFYTGAAILDWVMFFTGGDSLTPDLPSVSMEGIPQTIALFLTGLALISGGIIGIIRAIMDRN